MTHHLPSQFPAGAFYPKTIWIPIRLVAKRTLALITLSLLSISATGAELFSISACSSMIKISPDGNELTAPRQESVFLQCARDETESFQIAIIPSTDHKLRVSVAAGTFSEGIQIEWYREGFVKTANPTYPVSRVGLWPDPLFPSGDFELSGASVQPLWFNILVPPNAKPGNYKTAVTISAEGCEKSITLNLQVRDFTLPRPGNLIAPFGLYPRQIASWYFGPNHTDALKLDDFRKWMDLLVRNRITPKEIGEPFGKPASGSNRYSFSSLTNSLAPYQSQLAPGSVYIHRLPNATTIEGWLKEGKDPVRILTEKFSTRDAFAAWHNSGLPSNPYVYGCDEPTAGNTNLLKNIRRIYDAMLKVEPEAAIMQTIGGEADELVGAVKIWCPKTGSVLAPFFQKRVAAGDQLWTYVCCSPVYPDANLFVDNSAVESRGLFWLAYKAHATGFLYWATDWYQGMPGPSTNQSPVYPDETNWDFTRLESYFKPWVHVNGDGLLIYPGRNLQPLPSMRLFIIRDGIEDFEYLVLLEKLVSQVESIPAYQTTGGKKLTQAARLLTRIPDDLIHSSEVYTRNPERLAEQRRSIGDMIEQLEDVLHRSDWKGWSKTPQTP